MVNPPGVKSAGSSDYAVNFIPSGKQKFGQIGTVLAGYPGDKRCFYFLIFNFYIFTLGKEHLKESEAVMKLKLVSGNLAIKLAIYFLIFSPASG